MVRIVCDHGTARSLMRAHRTGMPVRNAVGCIAMSLAFKVWWHTTSFVEIERKR